jgi:hypothetical protein
VRASGPAPTRSDGAGTGLKKAEWKLVLDSTGRPLDVVRDVPGKDRFHLCGATPLTVPEPWSRATRERGNVLVMGLWQLSPDSTRAAVEDSEIVAITVPLITEGG